MDVTCNYLIELLRCALNGQVPSKKPENCSWEMLWKIICKNNIESTISPAIRRYPYKMPNQLRKMWCRALDQNLNRILQFEIEREQILSVLEEAQIAYMPLKGIILADWYPVPGMRWMSDNDILFGYVDQDNSGKWRFRGQTVDEQNRLKRQASLMVNQIMMQNRYQSMYHVGHHDAYYKDPIFNFEMHQKLVPDNNSAASYYENPWEKAVPLADKLYHFTLSIEDIYIYHIVHAYKHYDASGSGLRTLVDEYVILNKCKSMNWTYITSEMEQLDLQMFEQRLRKTALHAFDLNGVMDASDWRLIHSMAGCGTYGNREHKIQRRMNKIRYNQACSDRKTKVFYIIERIWPDELFIKANYPFFYRHRWFRIGLPFWRLGKGLLAHPQNLWSEWKNIQKYHYIKNDDMTLINQENKE